MSAQPKLKEINSMSKDIALTGWEVLKNSSAPDWVKTLRHKAYTHVQESGIPTPKSERFKYTDIPGFLRNTDLQFTAADIQSLDKSKYFKPLPENLDDLPEQLKEALQVLPAGEDKYKDMMLWHAANVFLQDGFTLIMPDNVVKETPLEIQITGKNGQYFVPRGLIECGANSEFTLIENHTGEGTYWNNQLTQVHVKENATFRHYRLQENSLNAAYTQNTHIRVDAGAHYEAFVMTTGAGLSRNQVHVELLGEGAECTLNGVNLLQDTQLGDTTITVEHKAPNCPSHQNYRSVLDGQSTGIFQGKVHVHRIAQKTDGYQKSDTLLISDSAQMNTKPELEIYADDVKCSHGTTSGKLDDTPLFYLRSRGIPEDEARALLIQSFVGEIVDSIGNTEFQNRIMEKVIKWLTP